MNQLTYFKKMKMPIVVSCIKLPHIFNPESIMINNRGYLNNYLDGSKLQEQDKMFIMREMAQHISNKVKIYK